MSEDASHAESYIPESAKAFVSIRTPQENIDKFGKDAPKNQLADPNSEPDPRQREMEAAYANERIKQESRFAKSDRLGGILIDAETPQDIVLCTESLRHIENWDYREGNNSYKFQNMISQAIENYDAYKLSHKELVSRGIVVGEIDTNGYIKNGGKIRFKGYEIRVEEEKQQSSRLRCKEIWEDDESTGDRKGYKKTWEKITDDIVVEKPNFFPENARFVLGDANLELAKQMITGQKQHFETELFDANRAALEEQVKLMYLKQIGFSNEQFSWFFNAAEINNMTAEKRENKELGQKRDVSMRMMRLIGHSETKEKMEAYLNNTFALEMILREGMIIKTLDLAGEKLTQGSNENNAQFSERRFITAARFLIGKDLNVRYEKRTNQEGNKITLRQYEIGGWLTAEERGVDTKVFRNNNKHKKGADAIKFETEDLKVRGYLTADGNTFSRSEMDLQISMLGKLGLLVGDQFAVRDADRMMWTRGGKDELGPEFYAFKHKEGLGGKIIYDRDKDGNLIPDLPTGEDLIEAWNKFDNDQEWAAWAEPMLKRFSLPGEPVGSDLSKIFWTYLYRLKDQLKERPTGQLLSTDKVPRLAQSLFSVVRTRRQTAYLDKKGDVVKENGKVLKVSCDRSAYEQWEGFKGDNFLAIETPIDLGNFQWSKVRAPEEIEEVAVNERRNATTPEELGVANAKIWEKLGIDGGAKQQIIADHGGNEKKALEFMIGKAFAADEGGVGDNADGFYKLLNFLAGDGKAEKRPWAYLTEATIDPKTLEYDATYTAKKKFLDIIFGAGGTFGDFRKFDRQAAQMRQGGQNVEAKDLIKREAAHNVSKTQKAWYSSLRSSVSFPTWLSLRSERINERGEGDSTTVLEVVEGKGKKRPGLAIKYGFFDEDPELAGKIPKIRMKI